MNDSAYSAAVTNLKNIHAWAKRTGHADYVTISGARDDVLGRYRSIFSTEHVASLSKEEFLSFLPFESNSHWGLQRQGSRMVADMNALRSALAVLLDESRPIAERFDHIIADIKGMGRGTASAILLVAYPDRYGVWNNTSEGGLRQLGLWPTFPWGTTEGAKYTEINGLLKRLAADVGLDLWTLDSLFWVYANAKDEVGDFEIEESPVQTSISQSPATTVQHRFGLERHLLDFLRDNWEHTDLGAEWDIYEESGNPDAGIEYPCGVGYIDILAKHKTEPRWLVVELKRGQTSDETVGQVLRYRGWVRQKLAKEGECVEGLVVAHAHDDKIAYALTDLPDVRMLLYRVSFSFEPANVTAT